MRYLGISGPAGSGKTTGARNLCDAYPDKFVSASFSKPMKDMLRVLGVDPDAKTVKWAPGVTVRQMLQTLGTEWGRARVSSEIWIWDLLRRYEGEKRIIVIDDVRFDNEADFCRRHGAVVHLTRANWLRGHVSEQGIAMHACDYVTEGNGSDELLTIVKDLWPDAC